MEHTTRDPQAPPVEPALHARVLESIAALLPRVLKRDLPPVDQDANLFEDLGLNSAGTLELILELEEDLDIQIDVEEIDQGDLRSPATLALFVAGHTLADE